MIGRKLKIEQQGTATMIWRSVVCTKYVTNTWPLVQCRRDRVGSGGNTDIGIGIEAYFSNLRR